MNLLSNRKKRLISVINKTTALSILSLFISFTKANIGFESKKDWMKEATQVSKIQRSIARLSNDVPTNKSFDIARSIYNASRVHHIDPKIIVSILQVESTFKQNVVSPTGDFSIAQINLKIWTKELSRLNKEPLDFERVKNDRDYAIYRMAEILSVLQRRHRTDKDWYASYHSINPLNKEVYKTKVIAELNKIRSL